MLRRAVPAALAASDTRPEDVVGIGIDFTACTVMPTIAGRHAALQVPGLGGSPMPTQAVEAPRGAGAGRPDHVARARARRAVDRPLRRPHLVGVGVRQGAAAARGGPRPSTRASDRFIEAADWIVWQLTGVETRNACTAGYKGIYQDGAWPDERLPRGARPWLRGLRAREDRPPDHAARRARGRPRSRRRAAHGTPPGHRGGGRERRCPHDRAGCPRDRAGPDGRDHGDVDLPRHERRSARRGPRHLRRGRGRHHARPVGLRGRSERRGRHLRAGSSSTASRPRTTSSPGRGARACTRRSAGSRGSAHRRRTASSRSTGTAATARSSSITR